MIAIIEGYMFEKIRDKFFSTVQAVLKQKNHQEILETTKSKTNKIVIDAEIEAQSKWVKEALHKREQEFKEQRPPKELTQEKEAFRLRMYQTTKQQKENPEKTLEK